MEERGEIGTGVKVKPVLSFATPSSNDMIPDRESRSKLERCNEYRFRLRSRCLGPPLLNSQTAQVDKFLLYLESSNANGRS